MLTRRIPALPVFLCISGALAAQNIPDSTDLYFRHLELGEVVVTGITGDTRVKETPSPVSVVTPQILRSGSSTNIVGALASQPGVSEVTSGAGISKPVIRGLGYNRVIVVQDGLRQEGQQWGDEHGVEIDGASVHSAEILKGPASLMYGSDALAGVLIFHGDPVAPEGTFPTDVSAEYQSNNGLLAYSLHHGGNRRGVVWDLRFSDRYAHAYHNSHDGFVPNSGFTERAASGMVGLNRKWGYSRLKLSWFHQTPGIIEGERDPETSVLEGALGYRPALPFQQVRHGKVVLDNTFRLPQGRIKALLGWQQNRRQEFEESPDEAGLHFLLNTLNYDIKYLNETPGGWKYAFGAGGMAQASENKGDEYLIPAYRLFDAGLFATASRNLGPWHLNGGLRGDVRWLHSLPLENRFEDFSRNYSGITGSLGAVRALGDNVNLRLNLARGFRAPNLSELGSNGEHEGTFRYEVGNKDLRPEYSLQGDLGLDFSSRYVSGQAAVFLNRIDNYIVPAATGGVEDGLPVFSYRATRAQLRGGEISLDFHPIHKLHLGGDFSYVHAAQQDGTPLPMIPAPRLKTEIKWEFSHEGKVLDNAYAEVEVDYTFPQNRFYGVDGTETATPGYCLLNASAGTDLFLRGKKRASLYLVAGNLTDVAWQSHLSRLKYAGLFNMGRNFCLKLVVPIA